MEHSTRVVVIVRYGYDVGIFSQWKTHADGHTPADWKAALAGKK